MIHYQTLSKNNTTWKIDVKNLPVFFITRLIFTILDKRDDFANKNFLLKRILQPHHQEVF